MTDESLLSDVIRVGTETEVVRTGAYRGQSYAVVRRNWWYCGYVHTDAPSSLSYDALEQAADLRVHGGLTFGVSGGWVGFDTAHAFDVNVDSDGDPLEPTLDRAPSDHKNTWDPDAVEAECKRLIDQLADWTRDVEGDDG